MRHNLLLIEDFCKTGKIHFESVIFRRSGANLEASLLFEPLEVSDIFNYDLSKSFSLSDFKIEGRKIIYIGKEEIPLLTDDEYWGKDGDPFDLAEMKKFHVKCPYYSESYIVKKQVLISYSFKPQNQFFFNENHLQIAHIFNKQEEIKMVVYGDSIAFGLTSSKAMKREPNIPPFFELLSSKIENDFGKKVTILNNSVIGTDSAWGDKNKIFNCSKDGDLYLINFGMNDGTGGVPEEDYVRNIKSIIDYIGDKYIILLSPILPNPDAQNDQDHYFLNKQEKYLPYLKSLETDKIKVCDLTNMHKMLLERKDYSSISGNNINHPNDFLSSCIAIKLIDMLLK